MRLAHFSDVHVSLPPFSQPPRRLLGKRLTGLVNYYLGGRRWHFANAEHRARRLLQDIDGQDVDHALGTGDLTGMSFPAEFERCAGLLDGPLARSGRLSLLPGNHDRYTVGAARERRFERSLGGLLSTDPTSYPLVRRLSSGVTLVALDVSRPSGLLDASGLCGHVQLSKLAGVLADRSLAGEYVVLALHYALLGPGSTRIRPRLSLRDGARLVELLDAPGSHVDLVLHGHVHDFFVTATRRRAVVCAGSATDLSRPCGYNILEIDVGRRTFALERRVWDPALDRYRSASNACRER